MITVQPKLRFPEFEEKYINKRVDDFAPLQRGFDLPITKMVKGKFPVVFSNGISKTHNEFKVKAPGIVTGRSGTIGNLFYIEEDFWPHNTSLWVTDFKGNFPKYVYYFYDKFDLKRFGTGSGVPTLNRNDVHNQQIYIPSPDEQTRIANFLSSVDEKLNLLKDKKSLLEDYKKGIMQKIFNQEIRFKDDNGNDFEDWEVKTIGESCICLDSQRKPLNGQERQLIQGVYPYWGANNIMDYIDDYIFDETIVLLAEDGGNFNEFKTRPIANFSKGKCWVNNHTHVLKGKEDVILNEFLFYSLVHKDITGFVSGGTRSKLIKSEMLKIPIDLPSIEEQTKIANFLSAIDEKIELVSIQIQDTQEYKKGLLQQMFV